MIARITRGRISGSHSGPNRVGTDVLHEEAGSNDKKFQGGLKRDCDAQGQLLPSRRSKETGRGMTLAEFVKDNNAVVANLEEHHVVALRLYTTDAFRTINNGLRDQKRYKKGKEHPLPVTVAFIAEALGWLRAVQGESAQSNTMVTLCTPIFGP